MQTGTGSGHCACGAGGCGGDPLKKFESFTISQLIEHIATRHHAYLKVELPKIRTQFELVASKYGDELPVLQYLLGLYEAFDEEMGRHLLKEEDVLFPILRKLELSQTAPRYDFGSIVEPLRALFQDHRGFESMLTEIQKRTGNFSPPPKAGSDLVALLEALRSLTEDTAMHSELEDRVLFQKAAEAEARLKGRNTGEVTWKR